MTNKLVMAVALLVACGGGEDAPSCQEAVTHYYNSGCVLVNLQTGQPFTVGEVTQNCKELLAAAPPQCEDDLANLRSCFGGVPAGASDAECRSCSDEQDAILTCE